MTSEQNGGNKKYQKYADKQNRFCRQRGGAVKKFKNSFNIIYGSPLKHSTITMTPGQKKSYTYMKCSTIRYAL